MTWLAVNIDHIATIRQARQTTGVAFSGVTDLLTCLTSLDISMIMEA